MTICNTIKKEEEETAAFFPPKSIQLQVGLHDNRYQDFTGKKKNFMEIESFEGHGRKVPSFTYQNYLRSVDLEYGI